MCVGVCEINCYTVTVLLCDELLDRILHSFGRGDERVGFISALGTHIYLVVVVLHTARHVDSSREVILVYASGIEYLSDVVLIHATACKELDSFVISFPLIQPFSIGILCIFLFFTFYFFDSFFELSQERNAVDRFRLLPGGEDAIAAKGDDVLKGLHGVRSSVEGTVEGDGHRTKCLNVFVCMGKAFGCIDAAFRSIDESAIRLYIDLSFLGEASDDHAIHSQLSAESDILLHTLQFERCVEKIAATWSDDDVQLGGGKQLASQFDLAI